MSKFNDQSKKLKNLYNYYLYYFINYNVAYFIVDNINDKIYRTNIKNF